MLQVHSEIGRLRQVLVHEPGLEVDHMTPSTMDELLFDDVLYGARAREEHALFRGVLQYFGVEVVEFLDLLRETFEQDAARAWVLEVLAEPGEASVADRLRELSPEALATALTVGVRAEGAGTGLSIEELFVVPPLPNWCFQRDPQVVIGHSVIPASMGVARQTEAVLSRAVFRFHPRFAGTDVLYDPLGTGPEGALVTGGNRPRLEGGDFTIVSGDMLLVGLSERTNRTAVLGLSKRMQSHEGAPRWMVVAELPRRRAYMHLDTVITPVDRDAALVHPPVILDDGPEQARVYTMDLHAKEPRLQAEPSLLAALKTRGVDLEPIPCGGKDPLVQHREQWTDGANALAVAPGVIVLYERNVHTAEELSRRGWNVVKASDLMLGKTDVGAEPSGRVCVLTEAHELSRARGGPHCLTHPLVRDPLA